MSLDYPFPTPAPGSFIEVAPGVRWIRMPLPFTLDHINLWAIDDDDGWTIVDTGVCTDDTSASWRAVFAAAGNPQVTRVIATHMHPDHVGMAGWLTRRFGCRLWMTRLEYLNCRALVADTGREAPADGIAFYRRAGWSAAAIEEYRARFGRFGRLVHALPDSFRRLVDGEHLRIGRHEWRVIVGRGHSPEHACLHCPSLGLLLSGDQVLPRISSNVSVYPMEPDADPVRYESLPRNALLQRARLIDALGAEQEPLNLPVFVAVSADDVEVDPAAVRDWFCRDPSGPRRLIWYASAPAPESRNRRQARPSGVRDLNGGPAPPRRAPRPPARPPARCASRRSPRSGS